MSNFAYGGTSGYLEPIIKNVYNEEGHLEVEHFRNGRWTAHQYDEVGNEILSHDNDGSWVRHEFDAVGNCIYIYDSDGNWSESKYLNDKYNSYDNNPLTSYTNQEGYELSLAFDENPLRLVSFYQKNEVEEARVRLKYGNDDKLTEIHMVINGKYTYYIDNPGRNYSDSDGNYWSSRFRIENPYHSIRTQVDDIIPYNLRNVLV